MHTLLLCRLARHFPGSDLLVKRPNLLDEGENQGQNASRYGSPGTHWAKGNDGVSIRARIYIDAVEPNPPPRNTAEAFYSLKTLARKRVCECLTTS